MRQNKSVARVASPIFSHRRSSCQGSYIIGCACEYSARPEPCSSLQTGLVATSHARSLSTSHISLSISSLPNRNRFDASIRTPHAHRGGTSIDHMLQKWRP
jgi:hypothetical protein